MKLLAPLLILCFAACSGEGQASFPQTSTKSTVMSDTVNKSEDEWKNILTSEQFYVLRQKGTERPFSGKFEKFDEQGHYVCAGCGNDLFVSDTKFDAGCGWPSFYDAIDKSKVKLLPDNSHGMRRIEVQCAKCGGHLGHVFNDGPRPTGLRYCINSVSIDFKADTLKK